MKVFIVITIIIILQNGERCESFDSFSTFYGKRDFNRLVHLHGNGNEEPIIPEQPSKSGYIIKILSRPKAEDLENYERLVELHGKPHKNLKWIAKWPYFLAPLKETLRRHLSSLNPKM